MSRVAKRRVAIAHESCHQARGSRVAKRAGVVSPSAGVVSLSARPGCSQVARDEARDRQTDRQRHHATSILHVPGLAGRDQPRLGGNHLLDAPHRVDVEVPCGCFVRLPSYKVMTACMPPPPKELTREVQRFQFTCPHRSSPKSRLHIRRSTQESFRYRPLPGAALPGAGAKA